MIIYLNSEPNNGQIITEYNSLLYTKEWINKAMDEGHFDYIPNRKISDIYSVGQIIAMKYILAELKENDNNKSISYCKSL